MAGLLIYSNGGHMSKVFQAYITHMSTILLWAVIKYGLCLVRLPVSLI